MLALSQEEPELSPCHEGKKKRKKKKTHLDTKSSQVRGATHFLSVSLGVTEYPIILLELSDLETSGMFPGSAEIKTHPGVGKRQCAKIKREEETSKGEAP